MLFRNLIVILLTAIIASIMATQCAEAATFSGKEGPCRNIAGVALDAAQMRDAGIGWEVFHPWIAEQLTEAQGSPQSFIKDESDAAYVLSAFKRVFDNPTTKPEDAFVQAFSECMKAQPSYKPLKGSGKPKAKAKKT